MLISCTTLSLKSVKETLFCHQMGSAHGSRDRAGGITSKGTAGGSSDQYASESDSKGMQQRDRQRVGTREINVSGLRSVIVPHAYHIVQVLM